MPKIKLKKSQLFKKTGKRGKKGGTSMMAAGVSGAVLGAALGGAAALTLTNREIRHILGQRLGDMREFALDTVDELTERADMGNHMLRDRIETVKKTARQGTRQAKKRISKIKH